MTTKQALRLANLHGVDVSAIPWTQARMTITKFLQACNSWLQTNKGSKHRLAFMRATKQPIVQGRAPYKRKRRRQINLITHTTDGARRKGKCVINPARQLIKLTHWLPIQASLHKYIYTPTGQKIPGRQAKVAHALGTSSSQVHRWSCPVCEHNQEPSFSIGCALFIFLLNENQTPA